MVMNETDPSSSPEQPTSPFSAAVGQEPQSQKTGLRRLVGKCFVGPNGMRAGWRLVIYLLIVTGLIAGLSFLARALHQAQPTPTPLEPHWLLSNDVVVFGVILFASWVMSRIEGRRVADYGLPLRQAFRSQFWQGVVIGFASISALLLSLRLIGVFRFGNIGLYGFELFRYALLWGAAFLFVGLFEEFFFRGYALFTLTTGMTFWPSAILLSALFGWLHHSNPSESWAAALEAALTGLLFCFVLRRTGNLWLPIGFHAAWDWGQTFFYGVPDSGYPATGHLLNPTFQGPVWLTGGSAGPEGSWLCIVLLVVVWIGFALWLPKKEYTATSISDPNG